MSVGIISMVIAFASICSSEMFFEVGFSWGFFVCLLFVRDTHFEMGVKKRTALKSIIQSAEVLVMLRTVEIAEG